jgi:hypothetical protein
MKTFHLKLPLNSYEFAIADLGKSDGFISQPEFPIAPSAKNMHIYVNAFIDGIVERVSDKNLPQVYIAKAYKDFPSQATKRIFPQISETVNSRCILLPTLQGLRSHWISKEFAILVS